jgi:hypothetical protein
MADTIGDLNDLTKAILDLLENPPMTKMVARTIAEKIDQRYAPGVPYSASIKEFAATDGMKEVNLCLETLVDHGEVVREVYTGLGGRYGGDLYYVKGPPV